MSVDLSNFIETWVKGSGFASRKSWLRPLVAIRTSGLKLPAYEPKPNLLFSNHLSSSTFAFTLDFDVVTILSPFLAWLGEMGGFAFASLCKEATYASAKVAESTGLEWQPNVVKVT